MSSQDLFQRVMDKNLEILSSIPNATPVADDMKIHGRAERDHDLALLHMLDKFQYADLHLNLEKISNQETICEILQKYAYNRWFTVK